MGKINTLETLNSILIRDDDKSSLDLLKHFLSSKIKAEIVTIRYPSQALSLSTDYFFDVILMDVTMEFRGGPYGGLEIYNKLLPRYGGSSLIAYSQRVTDELLKQYDYNFNFVDKHIEPIRFFEDIIGKIDAIRNRQTCFIAMPFVTKYDEIYETIKNSVERAGYRAIRLDEKEFIKSIVQKIYEEIAKAKVIIVLAIDMNPNVFYECGYSVALGKEVITITDKFSSLPFDIRDKNAIAYEEGSELSEQLFKKLIKLTQVPNLLESGIDLPTIQKLMGHDSIRTTMLYLRVTSHKLSHTQSPLDLLEFPDRAPQT